MLAWVRVAAEVAGFWTFWKVGTELVVRLISVTKCLTHLGVL